MVTCSAIWTLRNAKQHKLLEYLKRRTEQAAAVRQKEAERLREQQEQHAAQEAVRLAQEQAKRDAASAEAAKAQAWSDLLKRSENAEAELEDAKADLKVAEAELKLAKGIIAQLKENVSTWCTRFSVAALMVVSLLWVMLCIAHVIA